MKGTEKIIAHIENDAKAQAQAIIDEANRKAEEVRSAGEKAAQEAYDKLIREGKAECEAMLNRKIRMAEMEAKKEVLGAKQERVVETFAKSVSIICELPREEYAELFAKMAAKVSVSGTEEMYFCKNDKDECGQRIADRANELLAAQGKVGKLTVAEEAVNICGGFVLIENGIELNCSAEMLVDRCHKNMVAEVANALFE